MEQFKKLEDGSILCIPMNKKFSLLTAKHNGKNVFDGSYKDKNGNTWIKWVTYLTGEAAKREIIKQHKKLLKNETEVQEFLEYFSGKDTKEKIFSFVQMFDLGKLWFLSSEDKCWMIPWSISYITVQKLFQSNPQATSSSNIFRGECRWRLESLSNLYFLKQKDVFPFIVCEDL